MTLTYPTSHSQVGKYELGRTLGQGTFGKVKYARNMETGEYVAIKVLDKGMIKECKMMEQTKREISSMRLLKHPNIVRLLEVLATKTKIYLVLEYVSGGQITDKIVYQGFLKEDEARKYFQQLINAIHYCHSRGVFHRDLKPSNLLLDGRGNLKISDFGFSAIQEKHREDGLLKTKCGTPDYVAPEVINGDGGYKGSTADLWSCGVILFVLMAGYQPFHHSNLMTLYKKISRADFTCPSYFSAGARMLISQILDPNPRSRIAVPQILETEWFKKGYQRAKSIREEEDSNLLDIHALINDTSEHLVLEKKERKPLLFNAFELISSSRGLDLSGLFKGHPQGGSSLIIPRGPQKSEGRARATKSLVVGRNPRGYKGYPWSLKGVGCCFKSFVKVYLVCGSKCGPNKGPHLQPVDSIAY